MITNASLEPQSSAIWATASLMLLRSMACTPQSIRMCLAPFGVGNVNKKKSPKPTRNMRMRSPFTSWLEGAAAGDAASAAGALLAVLPFAVFRPAGLVLAWDVPGTFSFKVAMIKLLRATGRN
jgi:hypothetical protein